jgi:hypothetical protein
MTIAELYEIYYIVLATMDQIYEFWLTASFAVVIASYFAAKHLTRALYIVLALAYSLFSIWLAVRMWAASSKLEDIRARLLKLGETFADISLPFIVLLVSLYVLGFAGTLLFLRHSYNKLPGDS